MKRFVVSLLLALGLGTSLSVAQTQKVAYANEQKIIQALPAFKTQQKILESYGKQFKTQLEQKGAAIQQIQQFVQTNQNITPEVYQQKVNEYQKLMQEYQELEFNAQQRVRKKEQELMKPLQKKLMDTIKEVAIANGYSVVISENAVIYKNETEDITQKVIDKITGSN
ncbi:OmpH family outer membrane protein [Algivirga pacifica]|uniref:OmpH family outer membrane protein n=1 Tax=Algivirga pacifica TaxID=1162670 RepID=A0ABP9CY83_9BACT